MTTMEDLTKTQIVLLSLLVSFVASIATGIITTSLLSQAPVSVTQTINRVVERTIETVAPTPANPTGVVKEVTVVKEEDAILSSIEKVTNSVVRIKVRGGDGVDVFYGLGAIVSKEGLVVSDGGKLASGMTYTADLYDGSVLSLTVASEKSDDGIVLFKLAPSEAHPEFPFVTFAPVSPKLGQSVIAIEGREDTAIAVGRVTSLNTKTSADDIKSTATITTDIRAQGELSGSPLINLSGQLIGIKTSSADLTLSPGLYVAQEPIKKLIAQGGM